MTQMIIDKIQQYPDRVFFPNFGKDNIFTDGIDIDRVIFTIPGVNIDVYWYGFLIGIGVLIAIIYGFKKFEKFGINPDRATDAIIGGVIGAIIGARLYYVLFSWSNYVSNGKIDWKAVFSIRDGGLAIYGGIIGALLVGGIVARFRKIKLMPLFDIAAMGLLIGQAIGRWGNFFNQEAFGSNTNLPWGMTSKTVVDYLSSQSAEILKNTGTLVNPNVPVHPCFLYESLWCILGFIVLNTYMKHRKFDGEIFFMYIGWYGLGRMVIEGLRTDSLYITGTQIRVSQLLAAVCVAAAIITISVIRVKIIKNGEYKFFYETKQSIEQIEEYNESKEKFKEKKKNSDNPKLQKQKKNISEIVDSAFDDTITNNKTDDDEVNVSQIIDDDHDLNDDNQTNNYDDGEDFNDE